VRRRPAANACAKFKSLDGRPGASNGRETSSARHLFEELTRQHLIRAGFTFAPDDRLGFRAADGLFRHADGILGSGPALPGGRFSLHLEHKALGEKGWKSLERDGLENTYPGYAAGLAVPGLSRRHRHPAIFTHECQHCERLHLLHLFTPSARKCGPTAVAVIKATIAGELLPRAYDDPTIGDCRLCGHRSGAGNDCAGTDADRLGKFIRLFVVR